MSKHVNPTARHAHHAGVHHFHCHGGKCGRAFRHQPGAGLFCSERCEKAHEAAMRRSMKALTARGFVRDKAAPNVFTKKGVSITLEQIKFHGLQETIEAHRAAVARQ